jgi:hypothetical protein
MSAATRSRIAQAAKLRWAAFRARKEAAQQPVEKTRAERGAGRAGTRISPPPDNYW